MVKAKRGEILEKISDDLNAAMEVSTKIYAVDHIFISYDAGDDITISSEAADGIHIILDEIATQIAHSLLNAIELVDKLKIEEVRA